MVVMVSKDDSKSFSPGSSPGRARIAKQKPPRGAIWITLILLK